MSSIQEHLKLIKDSLPASVTLVAVSKTKPASAIEEAYAAGQRIFGENRVQEVEEKYALLPKDIQWHLIGHLQSNKVKYIAPFIAMIHAVDDEELLAVIDKEAKKNNRSIDCLIQIHIAQEESKFGMSEAEARHFFESGNWKQYSNVNIRGLMGMATFTEDEQQIREEFNGLSSLFKQLRGGVMANQPTFDQLSIGMSGDYRIAIEAGSTLVRVGSAIFGDRH
jgi:pyridoxal phosphate enzyme (YggS family)